jgi:AcrR family transcriptional regulator
MATATKYDRKEVIQKATDLFWEKGYHATSMRNLQEAIDLRPGSIYAGFGSKEGLFQESLRHYAHESLLLLKSFSENYESPLEALKAFVTSIVSIKETQTPSNMCMLVKTISELTEDNADLLAEAQKLLGSLEIAFADLFSLAQARGELNKSKDPKRLASLLQMQVMGLRAYIRSNQKANIEELIEDAFAAFL